MLTQLIHSMHALLSPRQEACLCCNQNIRRGSQFLLHNFDPLHQIDWIRAEKLFLPRPPAVRHPYLRLCNACLQQMAWIREIRCQQCGRGTGCPDCTRQQAIHYLSFQRSAVMYNSPMREWLAAYKYRGNERLLAILGEMLKYAYIQVLLEQQRRDGYYGIDLLTFVPVSHERWQERGFNQADELARILSRATQIPCYALLHRVRHTEKQSLKSRANRMEDMRNVFVADEEGRALLEQRGRHLNSPFLNRPLAIAIIDDIYTTGSTLNACAAELYRTLQPQHKIRIYGVTWARS